MISRLFKHRQPAYRPQAQARQDALRNEKLATPSHLAERRSLLRAASAWLVAPSCVAAVTAVALDFLSPAVTAAQNRHFPDATQLGRIRFGQFPEATLGRKAVRLGAGARIYNQDNLIVPPVSVHGKSFVVGYLAGPTGEITTVWILSEEEYRALRRRNR